MRYAIVVLLDDCVSGPKGETDKSVPVPSLLRDRRDEELGLLEGVMRIGVGETDPPVILDDVIDVFILEGVIVRLGVEVVVVVVVVGEEERRLVLMLV